MSATLGEVDPPPPPDTLECSAFVLPAGTLLHRIHDGRFGATAFNPGLGNTRFAPFAIDGAAVPTLYAATSLECAIFETIFHDIEPSAPFKSIGWSALEPLRHSVVETRRDMPLARLFTPDLMAWGLERRQIIDTARTAYEAIRAWVPVIHASPSAPEGMVWVSRAFDEEKALMLFGDRVESGDLETTTSARVAGDSDVLEALHALAKRAGITIVR